MNIESEKQASVAFLRGGGEMGFRMRSHDWLATALGEPNRWNAEFKTMVSLCLGASQPMFLAWGEPRIWLYNDAFTPILSDKHPHAFAKPAMEVWAEAWDVLGPMFDRVFSGESFYVDDFGIKLRRQGRLEEARFSLSYTPVRDPSGAVICLFGTCIETTSAIVNARLLMRSEERLQLALSAGNSVGTWDWDVVADRVYADSRFARLYGVEPERAEEGAPVAEFFNAIHRDDVERVQRDVAEALKTGEKFVSEYRLVQSDASERWVIAEGRCKLSPDGKALRFLGASFDITERKEAERRLWNVNAELERDIAARKLAEDHLEQSRLEFQALANLIPQLVWMARPDGHIFWYNMRWYEYTGTTAEQMAGWGWQSVHDPATLPSVIERWKSSLSSGSPFEMTFPLKGADGTYRSFLTRVVPVRNDVGQIIRWFGTNTDISEQKNQEEHLSFLMREMSHRSKNLLAVVQSIVRQLARGSDDISVYLSRISERLQALAFTHDQLVENNWQSVGLSRLLTNQVRPFLNDSQRFESDGPDIRLTPKAAESLGLAFHELATNAAKHGALSNEEGKIRVHWKLSAEPKDDPALEIMWEEFGGPIVQKPESNGFGSTVLDRVVTEALRGKAQIDFSPGGIVWSLTCPSNEVVISPNAKRSLLASW